jgi:hypothetical protein
VRAAGLGLRFICELAMLAGVAWCGWEITPALAVVFPLAFAAVWGVFVGPRARRRLPDPWRLGLELVLFALATAAYLSVGQTVLAVVFAVASVATAFVDRSA